MHGTDEIIREAEALPAEERARVVDSLLRTLNALNPEIDRAWSEVAARRLEELRSGAAAAVPGDEVLARIKARFKK
ncbi:MAG TPA: addiction module protein [bacterium]|nr:addiction module protein [bacterium]